MDFTEFDIGKTFLDNPIKALRSHNFYNDKWLYLMAGIHGDEIEGIFLINQLLPWLRESIKLTFPCIVVQTIDVDGYIFQDQRLAKRVNLNNCFPTSSFRSVNNEKNISSNSILRPEVSSLINLLTEYPPQMVLNLRTAHHNPKVVSVGSDGFSLASYLSTATHYPLVSDNQAPSSTLEAFIYDFFLCPVVTLRLPHFSEKKTIPTICEEHIGYIKQLLTGQIY